MRHATKSKASRWTENCFEDLKKNCTNAAKIWEDASHKCRLERLEAWETALNIEDDTQRKIAMKAIQPFNWRLRGEQLVRAVNAGLASKIEEALNGDSSYDMRTQYAYTGTVPIVVGHDRPIGTVPTIDDLMVYHRENKTDHQYDCWLESVHRKVFLSWDCI